MNWVYLTLKPLRLNQQKYIGLVDILDNPAELENFLRMEKWIFDSPDQVGESFHLHLQNSVFVHSHAGLRIGGEHLGASYDPSLNTVRG
jgi:polyhydroxyalkanoate synthase